MDNRTEQILRLMAKLENLIKNQESLEKDIKSLRSDINILKAEPNMEGKTKNIKEDLISVKKQELGHDMQHTGKKEKKEPWLLSKFPTLVKVNLEEFIGGNLISKIGIIIIILGVGIGAKFAIDHNLVSPLVRLILGYLVGILLLFFAFRTRKNYQNFSAVLTSGSLATIYFITYAGYSYYSIIPQIAAYVFMIAITAYAVYSSIQYEKEIIALIGQVGAYAIPFLLGAKTENYLVLFIYISIINGGILVVSIKKFWRWLLYGAFVVTWFLFLSWQRTIYIPASDFNTSLLFGTVFFSLFYLAFINHKLFYKQKFSFEDILLLITNSFIYYGVGYFSFSGYGPVEKFIGLFTLGNAALHLLVTAFLYKKRHPDKNLQQFLIGLAIAFITIAIPVQFEANWITLFWFAEALILIYIGRSKKTYFYEYLAYFILVLGFYSLLEDWSTANSWYHVDDPQTRLSPVFNVYFLTGFIALISTAMFNFIHFTGRFGEAPLKDPTLKNILDYGLAGVFIFICYYTFRNEIAIYWNQIYIDSEVPVPLQSESGRSYLLRNPDLRFFKIIWIFIYTLVFCSILTYLNTFVVKINKMVIPVISINSLVILAFLFQGLFVLSELRENFIDPSLSQDFNPGRWNIGIRYVGLVAVFGLIIFNYWYTMNKFKGKTISIVIDLFTYLSFLWILSSELIHWKDLFHASESYKIGLSILWGIFSLLLVSVGIWKRKKYLRIGGISLFGITLIKLFFYDLIDLNTISKTIVFISLGILLLIISFLYNKYRRILFG